MTDTRQSNIHESITTERRLAAALAEVERLRGENVEALGLLDRPDYAYIVSARTVRRAVRALKGNPRPGGDTVPTNREGHHGHDDR